MFSAEKSNSIDITNDGPKIRMPQSGVKPPMPHSNMKRSVVLANKGDSEPTIEPQSLIGDVFSKFMGIIQTVKNEFEATSLEQPAILSSGFKSQESGTKPLIMA